MGGINSLSGLNNVSVDFRPSLTTTNVQNTGNVGPLLPDAGGVPGDAQDAQQVNGNARSFVRELDVLLLNAAGKSVTADAAQNARTVGQSLLDKGVLTRKESSRLESLADDAAAKLRALDKFSGRDLAKALMRDKKTGETVWSKGFFGLNSAAKAVKAAIEAQQTLSTELGKFNERLARASSDVVDDTLQEQFTELQFQCDRRASEIDSIVFRMYDLAQKDVVTGASADPQTKALLDATFLELMPREAILMHGTAEAFEQLNANLVERMRPLAEKLDAFAADGSKVLGKEELRVLRNDMATMKNAIAEVRTNGIEVIHAGQDGNSQVTHIEVDKSLLDAMDKVLSDASKSIKHARSTSVSRAREAFLQEVSASLTPTDKPGGQPLSISSQTVVYELLRLKNEFVGLLRAFASEKRPMDQFDAAIDACIAKSGQVAFGNLENILAEAGADPSVAKGVAKTVGGLRLVKAQFKEMMASTARLLADGADFGIAADDVRRIMLGEAGLSNVIEAKALGFKPGDVDPAAEESNIVRSKPLGAGAGGKTYLLTTKAGGELVFKGELDSRAGLGEILLGGGGAYADKQTTANLNLATQDTAKAFGCEDVVVKYSVGSHDGQFGVFMEKAKGSSGRDVKFREAQDDDGIPPADMHKITDPVERTKIQGEIARKLNKLQWLDLITGQGDRHWNNYFVHVDKTTHAVTVKGIDNDASFPAWRIGLQKYSLDKGSAAAFEASLKNVCSKIHGRGGKTEYEARVSQDPAIVKNADGTVTVDLSKTQAPEIAMALIPLLGLQSTALPTEIDQEFFDILMEMDRTPAKKQAYLDSIAPRISPAALAATARRLDEAIAHAKMLKASNRVFGRDRWQNADTLSKMPNVKSKVNIVTSKGAGIEVKADLACVADYVERDCPSFYKRDFFHHMFDAPAPA